MDAVGSLDGSEFELEAVIVGRLIVRKGLRGELVTVGVQTTRDPAVLAGAEQAVEVLVRLVFGLSIAGRRRDRSFDGRDRIEFGIGSVRV